MRGTLIFGNGLGMALSPQSFNLTSVMSATWDTATLNQKQRDLIIACLPDGITKPSSEEQLATLQETVGACEVLLRNNLPRTIHWLTDTGKSFPDAIYRFSFEVARSMFLARKSIGDDQSDRCVLPDGFVDGLIDHIRSTHSHIATLNYDGLLSSAFRKNQLLESYSQKLHDGFVKGKFHRNNLFREVKDDAWYLHLHGCPLFSDRGQSKPQKLSLRALEQSSQQLKDVGKHIVLTHFQHKPRIIEASEVLSTYWEFLERAIEESEQITLFGYSGNDIHLNRLVAQMRLKKNIKVVEWLGAGNKKIRNGFWNEQLGGPVELCLLENVLSFDDW